MSIFSTLKSMFSGNDNKETAAELMPAEQYNDYRIIPAPAREDQGYRINGTIEKGDKVHTFIRADTLPSAELCAQEMIRKSKQMIDQQGDRIFE